ncbi:MAG: hypothetical protein ABIH23_32900 [bacterium]
MPDFSSQILTPSFLLFTALVVAFVFFCGMYGFRGMWRLLRNVKVAIAEIALISFFAIVGSTIVQGRDPQTYTQLYGHTIGNLIV